MALLRCSSIVLAAALLCTPRIAGAGPQKQMLSGDQLGRLIRIGAVPTSQHAAIIGRFVKEAKSAAANACKPVKGGVILCDPKAVATAVEKMDVLTAILWAIASTACTSSTAARNAGFVARSQAAQACKGAGALDTMSELAAAIVAAASAGKDDAVEAAAAHAQAVETQTNAAATAANGAAQSVGDRIRAGELTVRDAIERGLISIGDAISQGLISAADAISQGLISVVDAIRAGLITCGDAKSNGLLSQIAPCP